MANSKPILVISDKVRLELNQLLNELAQIEEAADKQQNAMVPEMEQVIGVCQACREKIAAFKATNFPNKK